MASKYGYYANPTTGKKEPVYRVGHKFGCPIVISPDRGHMFKISPSSFFEADGNCADFEWVRNLNLDTVDELDLSKPEQS